MPPTRSLVARAGKVLVPGQALPFPRLRRRLNPASRYRASHRNLLLDVSSRHPREETAGLNLGCILLPISRSFKEGLSGLQLAAELAMDLGCHLVVVCSKAARAEAFPAALKDALGKRLVLINHANVHQDWKADLESSRQRVGKFHRDNDAAEKRNLGLALASVLGWRSVLFMDDDVYPAAAGPTLDGPGLRRALVALEERPGLRAVGWSAAAMDDHSVIGHSRELVGLKQDIFVGAGALLVRCDQLTPYFANIYNHDWLFTITLAKNAPNPRKAIACAGEVRQAAYDPYIPKRARSEEAGDLLGECLMNLLEDHGAGFESRATKEFWDEALKARRELITTLIAMVGQRGERNPDDVADHARVQRALVAAGEVNGALRPADLAAYVAVLASDEERWRDHLKALGPVFGGPPEPHRVLAAVALGKPPAPTWRSPSPC